VKESFKFFYFLWFCAVVIVFLLTHSTSDLSQKLLPYNLDCFGKHLLLNFDPKTNKSSFPPGVQVRVPNFGMTKSMEYIDPSWEAYLLDNAGAYGEALAKRKKVNYLGFRSKYRKVFMFDST